MADPDRDPNPGPPKLDYRPVPRHSPEPVRWGRLADQLAGVAMVLLFIVGLVFCVLYPFFCGAMRGS